MPSLATVSGMYGASAAATSAAPASVPVSGGASLPASSTGSSMSQNSPSALGLSAADITNLIPASISNATILGQPLPWLGGLVVILLAIHALSHRTRNASEFATIKIGFENIMLVTLMAIVGITLLKAILSKYTVGGLSTIVLAA